MDRRLFLETLVGGLLAAPLVAEGQPAGKVYRVVFLTLLPVPDLFEALRQGLRTLGWTEGENFVLEEQRATTEEKVSALAAELARSHVDVIVITATAMPYLGNAAANTPVVFGIGDDPVRAGYVSSLAKPGGHMTGLRGQATSTPSGGGHPVRGPGPLSAAFLSGPEERTTTGYPHPFLAIAPLIIAAVSLGIARDAIESFRGLAQTKTPRRGTVALAQQHTVHQRVGQAEAHLRSSRAYLYDTSGQLDALRSRDAQTLTDTIAACRLASAHAAQSCVEAVDAMFDSGGGSSIYETSRLERCFRDVHVVTHHHMVGPSNIEMVGQYLLGLGLQPGR